MYAFTIYDWGNQVRARAIVTAAGVAGVGALIALSTAFPTAAENKPQVTIKSVLPVLTAPQSQEDRLPAGMQPSQLGNVSPGSVRYLGSNAAAKYWVGQAGIAKVCLIVQIPGGNHVSRQRVPFSATSTQGVPHCGLATKMTTRRVLLKAIFFPTTSIPPTSGRRVMRPIPCGEGPKPRIF